MSLLQRIFQRYTQQHATEAEQELVHQWYQSYDRQPAAEMSEQEEKEVRNAIWLKFNKGLQEAGDVPARSVLYMRTTWLKYATAAVVTGACLTGFYWLTSRKNTPQYTAVAAGAGQHKKVALPDGSSLMLGANSQINVPEDFNKEARELQMPYGEVFYDVAKDNGKPFVIQSGPLTVKVLGTSFYMRLLKGVGQQEVLVKSGRVQVSSGDSVFGVLTRGSRLLYDSASGGFAIQQNKEKMAEQLEQGWLVFENTPYPLFAAIMESHYNIQIEDPGKKLSMAHFTAAFPPAAPLRDIMSVMTGIHHVSYKIEEHRLIIK
ncbi:MAG: FecR domain-containing protein [Candidatus Pseudobacter hemicellulosilyticus]|uniref:FecR domain-containing protein n=1 Tax=Candidatus Pseudobacter hemicellulosilyticus TaxID=3121375 RepID=A0AAJ5WSR7_9BACT|nr:MAG: FecR domain-containing protein [Pseudobacter sp.]